MKRLALLLAIAGATALGGCGLHPLYEGGGSGPVASALSRVEVAPIAGKSGYLMSNALRDRLPDRGGEPALYRLEIKLDDSITGLGVRRDDTITRERRSLRARYQLVDAGTGEVVLDATAGSDAGIDVVNSEYATIAAENTALENLSNIVADQIVARIAVYARRSQAK
jgi:LPS-assembly lipoprotein